MKENKQHATKRGGYKQRHATRTCSDYDLWMGVMQVLSGNCLHKSESRGFDQKCQADKKITVSDGILWYSKKNLMQVWKWSPHWLTFNVFNDFHQQAFFFLYTFKSTLRHACGAIVCRRFCFSSKDMNFVSTKPIQNSRLLVSRGCQRAGNTFNAKKLGIRHYYPFLDMQYWETLGRLSHTNTSTPLNCISQHFNVIS